VAALVWACPHSAAACNGSEGSSTWQCTHTCAPRARCCSCCTQERAVPGAGTGPAAAAQHTAREQHGHRRRCRQGPRTGVGVGQGRPGGAGKGVRACEGTASSRRVCCCLRCPCLQRLPPAPNMLHPPTAPIALRPRSLQTHTHCTATALTGPGRGGLRAGVDGGQRQGDRERWRAREQGGGPHRLP
jgi:hypothetical protein